MTTAEKLQKIDEGVEETIALNAELEQTLYGTDVDKTLDENVEQTKSDFQAIKDKIVEHGVEVADGTKTAEYASKVDDVFEAGKKAEYDAFWDVYQKNGNVKNYSGAFFGEGWTAETFKPKYDIKPTLAYMMFRESAIAGDLVELLENLGVELDLSSLTGSQNYVFSITKFTRLGKLDFSNASTLTNVFANSNLLNTIDELIVSANNGFTNTFNSCESLEHLKISGTIGKNGLNLQWSTKLSHDSIVSVINALSTITSGLTVTLSKIAVNNAFETSEGAADGSTSTEWTTLIGTKTNWTISLV